MAREQAAASPWMSEQAAQEAAGALRAGAAAERARKSALLEDVFAMEGALSTHAPPHAVALALPRRWAELAKSAREAALSAKKGRLRSAIPPCCAFPKSGRLLRGVRHPALPAKQTSCMILSLPRIPLEGPTLDDRLRAS